MNIPSAKAQRSTGTLPLSIIIAVVRSMKYSESQCLQYLTEYSKESTKGVSYIILCSTMEISDKKEGDEERERERDKVGSEEGMQSPS